MKRFLIVTTCLAACCLRAMAAGPTPIDGPTTITVPGEYRVTRDIRVDIGPIISIQADSVKVDLGGYLVQADRGDSVIELAHVRNVEVSNGRIGTAYVPCLSVRLSDGFRLSDLECATVGGIEIHESSNGRIENLESRWGGVKTSDSRAITLRAVHHSVTWAGDAFSLDCDDCIVEECEIRGGGTNAIAVSGSRNVVRNSDIRDFSGSGVRILGEDNLIENNTFTMAIGAVRAVDLQGSNNSQRSNQTISTELSDKTSASTIFGIHFDGQSPPTASNATIDESWRTPIPISGAVVITEPGHYLVTGDLDSDGSAIVVASSNVFIDLGGHSVVGSPGLFASNVKNIEVRNGTLYSRNGLPNLQNVAGFRLADIRSGYSVAVVLRNAENGVIERTHGEFLGEGCRRLHVKSGSFRAAIHSVYTFECEHCLFEDLSLMPWGGGGIWVRGSHNVIRRCSIDQFDGNGIFVVGNNNLVEWNAITHTASFDATFWSIFLRGRGNRQQNNIVSRVWRERHAASPHTSGWPEHRIPCNGWITQEEICEEFVDLDAPGGTREPLELEQPDLRTRPLGVR